MRLFTFPRSALLLLVIVLLPATLHANTAGQLYQANTSITDALRFIGISADKHDKYKNIVKGRFPTSSEKGIVDDLVRMNAEKSVPLFLKLTRKSSVAELKSHVGNDDMVNRIISAIETGSYLGAPAGTRYFVTVAALSDEEKSTYTSRPGMRFAPLPTATITFYYFSALQSRLIGTRFDIAPKGDAFTLSLPSFK